jgi:uncharacterized phage protein (TIGR01671 family)
MKREIKFKIYNPLRKSMHIPCKIAINLNGKVFPDCDNWRDFTEECEQLILMQYTGLKDKNGKEIYEGDICLINIWFGELYSKGKLPIVFKKGIFGYELYCGSGDYQMMELDGHEEIIGNIYENPELLERKRNEEKL